MIIVLDTFIAVSTSSFAPVNFSGAGRASWKSGLWRVAQDAVYIALTKEKGLKQEQLSAKLGKANNYVMRAETGRIKTVPLVTMAKIAKILDISISDLFFFQGNDGSPDDLRARILRLVETDDVKKLRKYYRLLLVATEE